MNEKLLTNDWWKAEFSDSLADLFYYNRKECDEVSVEDMNEFIELRMSDPSEMQRLVDILIQSLNDTMNG